jgi:molybdopterin-guanine dinucleotide biosynthesis protein A
MIDNISGVILAGGENKRFNGMLKANLIVGGRTIISRTSDTLREIFREIIIVTNTPGKFDEYSDFRIVADIIKNKGPLGGIHAALKATSGEAVFVFAGDMPLIDKEIIISLIDSFATRHCDILIPGIGDYIEPLHSIYSKSIIPELEDFLKANKKSAVRDFTEQVNTFYMELENSEKTRRAFTNINYPEDLPALQKLLKIE